MPKTVTALVIFSFLLGSSAWAGSYNPSCINAVREMALNDLASGIVPMGAETPSGATYNFQRLGNIQRMGLQTRFELFRATSQRDRRNPDAVFAELYLFVEHETCILADAKLFH